MPPDMATSRRVMIYVPIMADATLIIATPMSALRKNAYCRKSIILC